MINQQNCKETSLALKHTVTKDSLTEKQVVMDIVGFDPPTGAVQEYLSNHPTVLLSKDRGVERIGKRDDERSISGVYTRAERK